MACFEVPTSVCMVPPIAMQRRRARRCCVGATTPAKLPELGCCWQPNGWKFASFRWLFFEQNFTKFTSFMSVMTLMSLSKMLYLKMIHIQIDIIIQYDIWYIILYVKREEILGFHGWIFLSSTWTADPVDTTNVWQRINEKAYFRRLLRSNMHSCWWKWMATWWHGDEHSKYESFTRTSVLSVLSSGVTFPFQLSVVVI